MATTPDHTEKLLTLKEACEELNGKVSLSSLYLAIEERRLPHYRVSGQGRRGKILVKRVDLLAWLEAQRITSVSAVPDGRGHIQSRP